MKTLKKSFLVLITAIFFCSSLVSAQYFQFNNQIYITKFYKSIFKDSYFANVDRLNLSQNVVFINCDSNKSRCSENKQQVEIWTEASDPENDVLIYHYKISGGEIVGKGEKVIWDLSNVEPGKYTIIAGVDDGCGICGHTKTRTIYVIECPKAFGIGYPSGIVHSVNVDQGEVFEVCQWFLKKERISCSNKENLVKVSTKTNVEDENKAIFKYEVTGGQIVGNGANVEWDLSKAEPGTYVVTASVDVGNGFCSNPKSTVVKVVECDRCKKRK